MKKLLIILSTVCALVACSSSTESKGTSDTTTVDGGPPTGDPPVNQDPNPANPHSGDLDAGPTNADAAPPVKEPTNQTECIAACEATHPTAAANNHQLDNSCFYGAACGNVCNNLGQGESKYPEPAAAAQCNTAAAGSYPIGTPSQACSNCLASTAECCNLWIAIFGSAEGQSLSTCAHDCWANFPQ